MCNRRSVSVSQNTCCIARLFLGILLLAVLFPVTPQVSGQQLDPRKPYALIFGTVWGPDNRPVYGVRVRIRRVDQKKAKWELYSDHSGEFAQRLPAGKADYIVWADPKSLKSLNRKEFEPGPAVTVHIAGDERADIGLHLK